jgi:Tfp pilus assembly protein PilF
MREITAYAARAAGAGDALAPLFDGSFEGMPADAAAERYYRIALELDSRCARALFNLGSLLDQRGELEGAVARLDRAAVVQSHYAPFADFRVAAALDRAGRQTEAAERWRRAAAHGAHFGQMHHRLALGLRAAGDIDAALVELDRCLDGSHFYAPEFSELRVPLPDFGGDAA